MGTGTQDRTGTGTDSGTWGTDDNDRGTGTQGTMGTGTHDRTGTGTWGTDDNERGTGTQGTMDRTGTGTQDTTSWRTDDSDRGTGTHFDSGSDQGTTGTFDQGSTGVGTTGTGTQNQTGTQSSAYPQEQNQQSSMDDVDYNDEIEENELPESVSTSLKELYPAHEVSKAYRGDDNSYKVEVENDNDKASVFFNSNGEFVKAEAKEDGGLFNRDKKDGDNEGGLFNRDKDKDNDGGLFNRDTDDIDNNNNNDDNR